MIPSGPAKNLSLDEIERRVAGAREAQSQWRRYTLSQRVRSVRGFWDHLMKSRDRIVSIIASETGKPKAEIEAVEISGSGIILKYFARNAHRILQDRATPRSWLFVNKRSYVRYLPRGVVGLITPWNFPMLIAFGDMIPALLAGNGVILKPSEWTTGIVQFLEDRFRTCGLFPEGLLQVAVGDGWVGAEVVKRVDMVMFTGSTASGRKVAEACGRRLIPVVTELGGLHPMIIAADAPLQRAAKAAAWGRFSNCGQVCTGVERVFVEKSVYPEFCALLEAEVAALRQAGRPLPPMKPGRTGLPPRQGEGGGYEVDVGRLIFPGQFEKVSAHIRDARQKGARVVGGEAADRDTLTISPALVFDARPDMAVMREETFGPVLAVMPVSRVDEAIRLANDTPYGLAASVWTGDHDRGEAWSALIEAGLVGVNDVLSHYLICSLPFGGFKDSGVGRRHSEEGLRMFCQSQSVIVHEWPSRLPDPWWFPYGRLKSKILDYLARLA